MRKQDVVGLCERVLFFEGLLNLFSGFLITFFPEFVMKQQGLVATNSLANGNLAQFGSLVLLLGYLGVRATPTPRVVGAFLSLSSLSFPYPPPSRSHTP